MIQTVKEIVQTCTNIKQIDLVFCLLSSMIKVIFYLSITKTFFVNYEVNLTRI